MPDNMRKSEDSTVKDAVEVEADTISEASDEEEKSKTTWQMASQYRAAIFWSSFIGLAGINWGMDTLVSAEVISQSQDLTKSLALERRHCSPLLSKRLRLPL